MKKSVSMLVAAALLSCGVAFADEAKKVEAAKPADKPVAEASKSAEAAPAPVVKKKIKRHHHKKATAKKVDAAAPAAPAEAPKQ